MNMLVIEDDKRIAGLVDVYIHGLRTKLEDKTHDKLPLIRSIHGTGYMFVTE
jgi:DNA-binding response OmpR family regulator